MANTEVIDRATVKEYCENYCRENIERVCLRTLFKFEEKEREKFEESANKAFSYLKGAMFGFGLYWLYNKRHWVW